MAIVTVPKPSSNPNLHGWELRAEGAFLAQIERMQQILCQMLEIILVLKQLDKFLPLTTERPVRDPVHETHPAIVVIPKGVRQIARMPSGEYPDPISASFSWGIKRSSSAGL